MKFNDILEHIHSLLDTRGKYVDRFVIEGNVLRTRTLLKPVEDGKYKRKTNEAVISYGYTDETIIPPDMTNSFDDVINLEEYRGLEYFNPRNDQMCFYEGCKNNVEEYHSEDGRVFVVFSAGKSCARRIVAIEPDRTSRKLYNIWEIVLTYDKYGRVADVLFKSHIQYVSGIERSRDGFARFVTWTVNRTEPYGDLVETGTAHSWEIYYVEKKGQKQKISSDITGYTFTSIDRNKNIVEMVGLSDNDISMSIYEDKCKISIFPTLMIKDYHKCKWYTTIKIIGMQHATYRISLTDSDNPHVEELSYLPDDWVAYPMGYSNLCGRTDEYGTITIKRVMAESEVKLGKCSKIQSVYDTNRDTFWLNVGKVRNPMEFV